jgi:hypothetical protein
MNSAYHFASIGRSFRAALARASMVVLAACTSATSTGTSENVATVPNPPLARVAPAPPSLDDVVRSWTALGSTASNDTSLDQLELAQPGLGPFNGAYTRYGREFDATNGGYTTVARVGVWTWNDSDTRKPVITFYDVPNELPIDAYAVLRVTGSARVRLVKVAEWRIGTRIDLSTRDSPPFPQSFEMAVTKFCATAADCGSRPNTVFTCVAATNDGERGECLGQFTPDADR